MNSISIEHGSNHGVTDDQIHLIERELSKLSTVTKSQWGSRSGAIDLITVIEVVGLFVSLKILDGLVEGIVGKNSFVKIGETLRRAMGSKFIQVSKTLNKIYEVFLSEQTDRKGAIAMIERFNNVSVYTVLNHHRITQNLILRYAEDMAIACTFLLENDLGDDFSGMAQLYPSFEEENWRYLFIPSNMAFGDFIDRYVDFSDMTIHEITSKDDFVRRFPDTDRDGFKILVTPKRDNWNMENV